MYSQVMTFGIHFRYYVKIRCFVQEIKLGSCKQFTSIIIIINKSIILNFIFLSKFFYSNRCKVKRNFRYLNIRVEKSS